VLAYLLKLRGAVEIFAPAGARHVGFWGQTAKNGVGGSQCTVLYCMVVYAGAEMGFFRFAGLAGFL